MRHVALAQASLASSLNEVFGKKRNTQIWSGMDKRFSFSFYNRVLGKSEGACKASTRHALKAAAALST